SWGSTVNFGVSSTVYAGTRAISVSTSGWGALYLHRSGPFDTSPYTVLRLAAQATQPGQQYLIRLYDAATNALVEQPLSRYGGDPPVGGWTMYTIPLVDLQGNSRSISGLSVQNPNGTPEPTLYLDEISFASR